jgi:hypothetical protein
MNAQLLKKLDYMDGRKVTGSDIQAISDYLRKKKSKSKKKEDEPK